MVCTGDPISGFKSASRGIPWTASFCNVGWSLDQAGDGQNCRASAQCEALSFSDYLSLQGGHFLQRGLPLVCQSERTG